MIPALFVLLACQLCGEVLVRALALPLPGPVAGLILLFAGLAVRGRGERAGTVPPELGAVCDALVRNLSLLFIPAAVGVVQYLGLMRTYAVPIAASIVASTVLALVVTALVFAAVSRLVARRRRGALAAGPPRRATETPGIREEAPR